MAIVWGEITSSSTIATVPAKTTSAITETLLLDIQQKTTLLKANQGLFRGRTNTFGKRPDLIDETKPVWYTPDRNTPVPAVPCSMAPELLVLNNTLHRHAGVGATLTLVRDHFHWPVIGRDTHLYVLVCGDSRRKRSRSQKIATLSGSTVEPWEILEVNIFSMGTISRTGNNYVLLVVDRASRFPFGFPLPSKGTKDEVQILVYLSLTFEAPRNFRGGGGEDRSKILELLRHWLYAKLDFGPTDHSRGQGTVKRFAGWLQEILTKLCKAWPDRCDEYVAPAYWIKRTRPDSSLPYKMTSFELLFGRKPRKSLDSLVPLLGDAKRSANLDTFVEQIKQNILDVRKVLDEVKP